MVYASALTSTAVPMLAFAPLDTFTTTELEGVMSIGMSALPGMPMGHAFSAHSSTRVRPSILATVCPSTVGSGDWAPRERLSAQPAILISD